MSRLHEYCITKIAWFLIQQRIDLDFGVQKLCEINEAVHFILSPRRHISNILQEELPIGPILLSLLYAAPSKHVQYDIALITLLHETSYDRKSHDL